MVYLLSLAMMVSGMMALLIHHVLSVDVKLMRIITPIRVATALVVLAVIEIGLFFSLVYHLDIGFTREMEIAFYYYSLGLVIIGLILMTVCIIVLGYYIWKNLSTGEIVTWEMLVSRDKWILVVIYFIFPASALIFLGVWGLVSLR